MFGGKVKELATTIHRLQDEERNLSNLATGCSARASTGIFQCKAETFFEATVHGPSSHKFESIIDELVGFVTDLKDWQHWVPLAKPKALIAPTPAGPVALQVQTLVQEVQALKLAMATGGPKAGKGTPPPNPGNHPKPGPSVPSPMKTPPQGNKLHAKVINGKTLQWCAVCGQWTVVHDAANHKSIAELKKKSGSEGATPDLSRTVVAGKRLAPAVAAATPASAPIPAVACNSTLTSPVDLLDLSRAPTPPFSNAADVTVGGHFTTTSPFNAIGPSEPVPSSASLFVDLIDLSAPAPSAQAGRLELARPCVPAGPGHQLDVAEGQVAPSSRHPEGKLSLAGSFPFMLDMSPPDMSDDELSTGSHAWPGLVNHAWFDGSDSDASFTASAKSMVSWSDDAAHNNQTSVTSVHRRTQWFWPPKV